MLCALNEASNPSTDNRPLYFLWSDLHVTHTDNVLLLSVYVPGIIVRARTAVFSRGGGGSSSGGWGKIKLKLTLPRIFRVFLNVECQIVFAIQR